MYFEVEHTNFTSQKYAFTENVAKKILDDKFLRKYELLYVITITIIIIIIIVGK